MPKDPTDSELKKRIENLVRTVDIQSTRLKQFIKLLSKQYGVDLTPRKAFIRDVISEAIENLSNDSGADNDDDAEEDDESENNHDDDDDDSVSNDKSKNNKIKKPTAKSRGGSGGGGLATRLEISDKLEKFLKKGKLMSRTEIVKSLWEYIRENDLQNPNNKREIILDAAMKKAFGCDKFTMFTMNKYIGAHIYPFKPVDLTERSASHKKGKSESKSPAKRKTSKGGKDGKKEKKKRKTGTQPPYRLSRELQAVVKEEILPRPQVVSKIWKYIKANGLQSEENRREVKCDAKLKAIMKKSKVTMFEITRLLSPHLLEKVDRSLYMHREEDDNDDVEDDDEEEEEEEEETDEDEDDE